MKLTKIERLSLYNQYRILEALYPDEAKEFAILREAIEDGYELEYERITQHFVDGLSEEECREVINVMEMFSCIKNSFETLQDKSEIDEYKISFHGFSGNEETMQMAYAQYLQKTGRFMRLVTDDDCNSHFVALKGNRRMLAEWEKSENKHHLTKEDILRIQSAFKMD